MAINSKKEGNYLLLDALSKAGINIFTGVTGGGVIHLLKYLHPLNFLPKTNLTAPHYFTIYEYVAGYIPLGSFLATKKIGACLTTTGIANELGLCATSDALLNNLPMLSLLALNSTLSIGLSPIQDNSPYGTNLIQQLKAKFKDRFFIMGNIDKLDEILTKTFELLSANQPVAIAFFPDILSQYREELILPSLLNKQPSFSHDAFEKFMHDFPEQAKGKRVILYVGLEAALAWDRSISSLITSLSELLEAPTIWSINGANAIERTNRYCYGCISLGGNDRSMELWDSINLDDIVIVLGCDFGEYDLNQKPILGNVWHFTSYSNPYGSENGGFQDRVKGFYHKVTGDIYTVLQKILERLPKSMIEPRLPIPLFTDLNIRPINRNVSPNCVDLAAFFEQLDAYWQFPTILFDDVCVAYRDRQYVVQRPNPSVRFFSLHQSSSMGAAFGLGIGAKLADSSLHTFVFTGDGCFRLFGGALVEAAKLGIRLFILNNASYSIVSQALDDIIPDLDPYFYHTDLKTIDFVKSAEASGWIGFRLKPDLSNFSQIMEACYDETLPSILVEVPVDPRQEIGRNPRIEHLTINSYL